MLSKRAIFILLLLIVAVTALSAVNASDFSEDANNASFDGLQITDEAELESGDNDNDDILTVESNEDDRESDSPCDTLGADSSIYFDASVEQDGDGSKNRPYKYLKSDRMVSGGTIHFAGGTYVLNSTCVFTIDTKITGEYNTRICSKLPDQYDFIIKKNTRLELDHLFFADFNILNQGTLIGNSLSFEGHDVFDSQYGPEIQQGSGAFDSSYGGIIVCDTPDNIRNTLSLEACTFVNAQNAYNGGVIAAINSNITLSRCEFSQYSATYKGGAIYCVNSNMTIRFGLFDALTNLGDYDFTVGHLNDYTAYYGGSIYCENSYIYQYMPKFRGSIAYSFGGILAALKSNVTIREGYYNDSASLSDGGGAIYNSQGELYVIGTKFYRNRAEFGGAICNINSILDSYRGWYIDSYANYYGGAIYDIYGSINLNTNLFGNSHALAGGTIYTRIPNKFNLYQNSIGDTFAEKGSAIFFDGKKENIDSDFFSSKFSINYDDLMIPLNSTGMESFNTYANDYHIFAEFTATLNGQEYSIISNPIYYQVSSKNVTDLYFPWQTYEVYDDFVTMKISDSRDNLSSVACGSEIRDIIANISFSDQLVNPKLTFYLFEHLNVLLYNYGLPGNRYDRPRENLFKYNLVGTYSIDLSNKAGTNVVENCSVDFSNPFLSVKYDNLYDASSFYPVSLVNASFFDSSLFNPAILASYYNSNDYGFVSSVKDQKEGSNCWAFAGLATLETCLKKATGVTYDFSEENAKNLMAAYSVFGLKLESNHGGYDYMLMSYLTSWLGPIDESVEDYDDYSSISVQGNPMFHIQNIKFLPVRLDSSDNDIYKMAIRDYGAVSVNIIFGGPHVISLVGWDDNYVGKDSLGNDAHGAWIFKNSWGEDWGNNGFGYLSYEEKIAEEISPNMHAYTFIFTDTNPYTKIYQYDFAGVSEFYHYTDSIHFKNSFVAEEDSILSAFSTYFDDSTNFTVKVYKNGQFVFSQDGTSPAGYYTIPLNTVIRLDKGDEFSIEVHNHNSGRNCIPVCSADEITKKTFNQNVSFISQDGVTWHDLYDYGGGCYVACIKAFTQNVNLTGIRINVDEFSTINTKNFNVKAYFEDFDAINSINYCLVEFIVDGEIYYAQIRNGVASLNLNLDEGPHSLSAQYKNNVFESNIVKFNFNVVCDDTNQFLSTLQDIINNAAVNSTVNLNRDYVYNNHFDDEEYGIIISKPLTINGNGHVIDGLSKATGLYVAANNVVMNDLVFKNACSVSGGALYIAGRNVTLNNCVFINNSAQYGGGIYSLFDVSLNGCSFINNSAYMGGGAYLIASATTSIKNSNFDNNFAERDGSALYLAGIGNNVISSTNFTDNLAFFNGGAVFTSAYYNNFTDCSFSDNTANAGGAIFSNAHSCDLTNCRFTNNFVEKCGGAIMVHNLINIHNSVFINNTVNKTEDIVQDGGAICSYDELNIYDSYFEQNYALAGGAIHASKYINVYRSDFINNSGSSSSGVYVTSSVLIEQTAEITRWRYKFSEGNFYDSRFINNTGRSSGAVEGANLIDNCTFYGNSANYGAAVYNARLVTGSRFINNRAEASGGAGYFSTNNDCLVYDSIFKNNSASVGGAYYVKPISYATFVHMISNSKFINNFANYGGAIILIGEDKTSKNCLIISSSDFDGNIANYSGGAVYAEGRSLIKDSNFTANSGVYGGAIFLEEDGSYAIEISRFHDNFADFGGAIIALSSTEASIVVFNVSSCDFYNNVANRSGGAIYTEGRCNVLSSNMVNNTATWGPAIYSRAYLDLRNSYIKSDQDVAAISYSYYYSDNPVYGGLYLKNNRIDTRYVGVLYNENEIPYTSQLKLVFTNLLAVKGKYVCVCRVEDDNGNSFSAYGTADLDIILTNQNNKPTKLRLQYDVEYGGFYLDTSKLDYGTYKLTGTLTKNHPGKYSVKQGILYVVDESGRTSPVLKSSGLTKVYGKSDKLTVTLKDAAGNPIAYNLIEVTLNGKPITIITNDKGQASLEVNLAPKTYDAYISFKDSDYYHASSITVKVVIKKATPKMTASKKTFKAKVKTKKYTITLKNNLGKVMKNTKVTLKVKGKKYTAKTNAKGKATFKIKNLKKKGNFYATVKYGGNAYYNAVTKKVKITIKK